MAYEVEILTARGQFLWQMCDLRLVLLFRLYQISRRNLRSLMQCSDGDF
jgi:hypothetical protein